MSVTHGRNVRIYQGSTGTSPIIAAAKTATITKQAEVVEKSSSASSTAKEYIAGRTEWDVALNHLVTSGSGINPFAGILEVGQTYTLRANIDGVEMSGTAICTEATITGTVGSLAQGSIKFKGTGELSSVATS